MNIILAHGILGFRQHLGINYFNRIEEHLKQRSLRVLATVVDPVRGIATRGAQLRQQILGAFENGALDGAEKTHIIAHSMGGFDARFALSPDNPDNIADRIASLTTIGTPHLGSPVADLLFSAVDGKSLFGLAGGKLEGVVRNIVEKLGISLDGLHDLTTATTTEFNHRFGDHDQVRYFSIAGGGRKKFFPTCGLLVPAHALVESVENENDGLVSVKSASRWENTILWPADHADEVGHDLDRGLESSPENFDHLAEYDKLVARLAAI